MEKPDVLSDEQIGRALTIDFKETTGKDPKEYFSYVSENDRVIAQAQRDADYKHEQDTAREIFEESENNCIHNPMYIKRRCDTCWQSLESKFLIPPNPVGSADV